MYFSSSSSIKRYSLALSFRYFLYFLLTFSELSLFIFVRDIVLAPTGSDRYMTFENGTRLKTTLGRYLTICGGFSKFSSFSCKFEKVLRGDLSLLDSNGSAFWLKRILNFLNFF